MVLLYSCRDYITHSVPAERARRREEWEGGGREEEGGGRREGAR